MKKKKIIKYFNREWKGMKYRLKSYLKEEEQEDLHQFRVQVKKLQAFLILSDHTGHHAKLTPYFKPVKKVFKQAGELRNAYISEALTRRRQPRDKAAQNFGLQVDKHWKNIKKAHRALKTKIKPIKNASVQRFYQNQLREIAGALVPLPPDDQLHEYRKRIKVLLYNYQLVRVKLAIILDTVYLDQVQEAIGNWHDQRLAIALSDKDEASASQLEDQYCRQKMVIVGLTNNFYKRARGQKL